MNKVVITAAEGITPIGTSFSEILNGIKYGIKGIDKIKNFDTSYFETKLGAEVKENGEVIKTASNVDRKNMFLTKTLNNLLKKSNIDSYADDKRYINIGAGIDYFDLQSYMKNSDSNSENWQKYSFKTNDQVKCLAEKYNIKGGYSINVSACVASSQAIGLSYRMIKNSSEERFVVTGGYDSMLNHLHYMGFYKLGALSNWQDEPSEACRPFDKERCGLVLGEGAAVITLENEEKCRKENILAEISGYSSTLDSYMVSDPRPDGKMLAVAAINAIREAGISPENIDCVHLHGTGTHKNALAETNAMKIIFGDKYTEVPVFSLKGQVGHLIAACGAIEMIGVLYSLKYQEIPVTVNYKTPDKNVPLFVIKDQPLKRRINYILKLNSAFGGQNTAFVVKKYE